MNSNTVHVCERRARVITTLADELLRDLEHVSRVDLRDRLGQIVTAAGDIERAAFDVQRQLRDLID